MFQIQLRTLFVLVACVALVAFGWRLGEAFSEDRSVYYHLHIAVASMAVILIHGSWRVVPLALLGAAIGTTSFLVPIFNLPYTFTDEDRLIAGYVVGSAGCSVGAVLGSGYLCYRDKKLRATGMKQSRIAEAVPRLCLLASLTTTGTHLRHLSLVIESVL